MSIPVVRSKRRKLLSDPASPVLNYLKRAPGYSRTYTIDDVASETELVGAMSAEDVSHVMKSFVRSLKKILVKGDKVKIDGLGTFHITFNCRGTEEEKECTVKNIRRVNVRFFVDNTFRLTNDSTATTRGGSNNVEFFIKGESSGSGKVPKPEGGGGDSGGDGGDDDYTDPDA